MQNLLKQNYEKILHLNTSNFWGDYPTVFNGIFVFFAWFDTKCFDNRWVFFYTLYMLYFGIWGGQEHNIISRGSHADVVVCSPWQRLFELGERISRKAPSVRGRFLCLTYKIRKGFFDVFVWGNDSSR
jgi:hypothetical protein